MIFTDVAIVLIHLLATIALIAWALFLPARSKSGFILQSMSVCILFCILSMLAIASLSSSL